MSIQVRAALVCILEAAFLSLLKSRQEAAEDVRAGSAHVASPEQVALRTQDAALWKLRKRWARDCKECHLLRTVSFRKDMKGFVFSTFSPKLLISCPGNSSAKSNKTKLFKQALRDVLEVRALG